MAPVVCTYLLQILFLCVPNPLHSLGDADIVGLELVETNTDCKRSKVQRPHHEFLDVWQAVMWDIVDNDGSRIVGKYDIKAMRLLHTYWNPMCEWIRMLAAKTESNTGFSDPATNGATVSGTRAADMSLGFVSRVFCACHILYDLYLSNVQW